MLVSYGEPVVDVLAHFLRDPEEDIWVRRHIPTTLAQIPSQKSVDVLVAALDGADGFLRYKVDRRTRTSAPHRRAALVPAGDARSADAPRGGAVTSTICRCTTTCSGRSRSTSDPAVEDARAEDGAHKDRIYRLLALIYPWRDIGAAQWTLAHGDARSRASASEYLDNILTGQLRKRIMPVLEDLPPEERVRRGNVLLKTRPRDVEETLLQLDQRRRPGGGRGGDRRRPAAADVDARRRHRARARASRRARLVCIRSRVVGARRAADAGRTPARALARAAARRRRSPHGCGRCRSSRRSASTSCSGWPAPPGRCAISPARAAAGRQSCRTRFTCCSTAGSRQPGRSQRRSPSRRPRRWDSSQALQGVAMRTHDPHGRHGGHARADRGRTSARCSPTTPISCAACSRRWPTRRPGDVQQPAIDWRRAPNCAELAADGVLPVEKILALQRVPVFARIAADEMGGARRHRADGDDDRRHVALHRIRAGGVLADPVR